MAGEGEPVPRGSHSLLTWALSPMPLRSQVALWHTGVTSSRPKVSQLLSGSQFPNLANGHNSVCWSSGFRIGGGP